MSFSIERNGYITFKSLVIALAEDLKAHGFTIQNVDGVQTDDVSDINLKFWASADPQIDPVQNTQPWVLALIYSEEQQFIDIYICTPDQVLNRTEDFYIARKLVTETSIQTAGKTTLYSLEYEGEGEERKVYRTASFEEWQIPNSDTAANPISYRLAITDHGFSVQFWVESYDSYGDKFSWVVVQRMIDNDGNTVTTGKSPLFCLFANRGYSDNEGKADPESIQQFVVRESDVNSPTIPTSAIEDTADTDRIINGSQQVAIREDLTLVLHYPNELSSDRYKYPHQLDLLAYTSADVVSQSMDLDVTVFGEATPRKYRGMNADREFNRGVRIMFWAEGGSF